VVIASGADPKHLDVPGEREYNWTAGFPIVQHATDTSFKEKEVIVVGGGDSAVEEGLFLTRFAKKVTIVHRRDALRAGAILQTKSICNPKIQFNWNSVVTHIQGKEFTEK
jgi:thioredoxin reductase (NADPH)